MRLQDIIMREAPSAYIFESDGAVHRRRQFEDEDEDGISLADVAMAGAEAVIR
jgi:hypothetical protein